MYENCKCVFGYLLYTVALAVVMHIKVQNNELFKNYQGNIDQHTVRVCAWKALV